MPVLIETDRLSAGARLERCRAALLSQPVPVHLGLLPPAALTSTRLEYRQFGSLIVTRVAHVIDGIGQVERSERLIRRSDPEVLRLMVCLRGGNVMTQDHRETSLGVHDMALFDSSRPFRVRLQPDRGRLHEFAMLTFPRAELDLPAGTLRELTCVRLSGRAPIGGLLRGYAMGLLDDLERHRETDAAALTRVFLDLLGACVSSELALPSPVPVHSRNEVLFRLVTTFILEHLADPALGPVEVAAAHHIAVRTLHALFAQQGYTVAAWIRTRRLERCRQDLADPLLDDVPVGKVGARWGIPDAAQFSRTFRAEFGISPRAHREQCRAARRGTGTPQPAAEGARVFRLRRTVPRPAREVGGPER